MILSLSTVTIILLAFALAAFLVARWRSRLGWWLLAGAFLLLGMGGGGFYLLEKGKQATIASLPVTAHTQAWAANLSLLAGAGIVTGLLLALLMSGVRRFQKA